MSLITINSSCSIEDVEAYLTRLSQIPVQSRCELRISQRLESRQFGGQASLIQFLITWSKHKGARRLITYVSKLGLANAQLRKHMVQDHILACTLLASDISDSKGKTSLKSEAHDAAKYRIEKMERGIRACKRGPKILLLCVDHSTKAYLPLLYYPVPNIEGKIRDQQEFHALAREMIQHTAHHFRKDMIPENVHQAIGSILYELFKNTHDWARSNINGSRIYPSIRGILFEYHRNTRQSTFYQMRKTPVICHYLASERFHRVDEHLRFLEISLFDSGPGLAQRWTGREISSPNPKLEYKAVIECLTRHYSTSNELHRGIGLYKVMQMLTLVGGFLRIRTGHLSLQRDFNTHPYKPDDELRPRLFDWSEVPGEINQYSRAAGTLITMLVPLQARDT